MNKFEDKLMVFGFMTFMMAFLALCFYDSFKSYELELLKIKNNCEVTKHE